jgi:molybdenum cofactor cytidylyltransferase
VALAGVEAATVHNPDFAGGLSTSLRAGIANLPADTDGVVVLLADMPAITATAVDKLIAAFDPDRIVVATSDGRRGNPVLWPRRFFADLMAVSGDTGGRRIIEADRAAVVEVEVGTPAALDIDTPEALRAVGGTPG